MREVEGSTGGRAAFGRDWTQGSVIGNLLRLSWPMMISSSLNMLGPTIDMIWVGKLGTAPIAGVGVAGTAVMLVNSAMMGFVVGARAIIARFMGAGDARGANHAARQAFVLSASFGIALAAIGMFFAESILMLMGVEPAVVTQGAAYLRIMFVGSLAMSVRMITEGTMQASGDSMTPMKIAVSFRLLHIAICPLFVFGWWLFPRLGVSGAAVTNVMSQTLGMALGLWFLFSGRTRLRLTLDNFRFDPGIIWRIVRIGIPASFTGMGRSLGHFALMWIMVPFGTLAVAAHSLTQRIEVQLFFPIMGLGMGAGVLAGQNLGAGQPERAERSSWLAVGLGEGFMVACAVLILLWAEKAVGIFSTEPALVELASIFLRIAAVGYLVLGLNAVMGQCLSGVGDTVPPMLVTILTIWVMQIPLSLLLPRVTNLDVYGVRWAMVIGMVAGAVAYIIYFRLGRWKRKRV